jgi:hypothetical protein
MIKFNSLLKDEGIDPAEVKLVRHQDTRWTPGAYQLWLQPLSHEKKWKQRNGFRSLKPLAFVASRPKQSDA